MIVDGTAISYRDYCATEDCIPSMISRILRWVQKYQPKMTYIAWDGPRSRDTRKSIYSEYKGNRKKKPKEYFGQVAEVKEIFQIFGFHQFEGPGEGDDVIATLCRQRIGQKLIITVDKDLVQLIGPEVCLLRVLEEEIFLDIMNCRDLFGFHPEEWLDYQTIVGDSGDGVPGIVGVGDKGARAILQACPDFLYILQKSNSSNAFEELQKALNGSGKTEFTLNAARLILEQLDRLDETRRLVELKDIPLEVCSGSKDLHKAIDWLADRRLEHLMWRAMDVLK
jgi:5'-3' exonuclease